MTRLHAEAVDLGDREHAHARAPQPLALAGIERADADQDACAPRRPTAPASARPRSARRPSRARRSAPCRARCPTASSRACCSRRGRRTRSSPTGPCTRASPPKTPSASEWSPPSTSGSSPARGGGLHVAGDLVADGEDLVQVLGALVAPSSASIGSSATVPRSCTPTPELGEAPDEPGVADRRRPHVDAAPALPEVERGAEHGDARRERACSRAAPSAAAGRALRPAPPARRGRRRAGRPPRGSGTDDPARLAHEQVARRVIPLGQAVLVERVQAARRDPRQIERGRARAADVARPRQHAREQRRSAARARPRRTRSRCRRARARAAGGAPSRSGSPLSAHRRRARR